MYEKLHLCHLPDLDWYVPVSNEITWGRPLRQEEIDRMNAVLGLAPEIAIDAIAQRQDVTARMNAVLGIPPGQDANQDANQDAKPKDKDI